MKKQSVLLLLILLLVTIVKAQIVDVPPNGKADYLPVQGGSVKMDIDTTTPLATLIKKLEQSWEFEETGKMYWIGYTNTMYSIAARSNAIKPLRTFIDTTKNAHAKYGAVYTLHLIGINRIIAGRFYEEFKNKEARDALISLLKYDDLRETALSLLMRDPWMSDVPQMLSLMVNNRTDDWDIVDALLHYQINGFPLNNRVPESIGKMKIRFPRPNPSSVSKEHCNAELQKVLRLVVNLKSPSIIVEKSLFGADLWGNTYYDINGNLAAEDTGSITISSFLNDIKPFMEYTSLGNKIYYYVDTDKLYICSAQTAKARLLNWWDKQDSTYKQQFMPDRATAKQVRF